jgi:hypothetical protein
MAKGLSAATSECHANRVLPNTLASGSPLRDLYGSGAAVAEAEDRLRFNNPRRGRLFETTYATSPTTD